MDAPTPIEATTRVRMGPGDARYGGDLIEGARTLTLFGDLVTELAIRTDGDEGLLAGYERVEFLAPVHVGDYLDLCARIVRIGNTSRTVELEARKVIAARRDIAPSAADALDESVVTCRALRDDRHPRGALSPVADPRPPGRLGPARRPGNRQ